MTTVNKIDVPPSVFPLLGCTDTYGKIDNTSRNTKIFNFFILSYIKKIKIVKLKK